MWITRDRFYGTCRWQSGITDDSAYCLKNKLRSCFVETHIAANIGIEVIYTCIRLACMYQKETYESRFLYFLLEGGVLFGGESIRPQNKKNKERTRPVLTSPLSSARRRWRERERDRERERERERPRGETSTHVSSILSLKVVNSLVKRGLDLREREKERER